MEKLILNLEIICGTRGKHGQVETSGKSGPLLVKNEVSRIIDFGHFTKISQLIGHFGKVLKSSNQCLWSHVILIYQSQVMVFDLKCLFVDF